MENKIMGVIACLILLCLYMTVLIALIPVMPILSLAVIALWMIIRRPFMYPGRMEDDVKRFSRALGEAVRKLLQFLFQLRF